METRKRLLSNSQEEPYKTVEEAIETLIHMFVHKKLSYPKIVKSSLLSLSNPTWSKESIQRTLESFRLIEEGLNYGMSADNNLIFRLTPNEVYWKYVESSRNPLKAKSSFWELPLVKALISDIFSSKKDVFTVANRLGVTSEMICSNIVKSKIWISNKSNNENNKTRPVPLNKYPTFKNYKYNDFWNERAVKEIMEDIRQKKLSLEEGSEILGVTIKKIRAKIGFKNFRSKTSPKNGSEKGIASISRVSPYEEIRNRNINERNALLQKLNLASLRPSEVVTKQRRYRKRNKSLESSRRPSGRIQMKKPLDHSGALYSLVQSASCPTTMTIVPPVPHMDLDEFFVHRIDYQRGKRLLNEIRNSFLSDSEISSTTDFLKKPLQITQFSENKIVTCDILRESSLIAVGDKFGEVGIGKCNETVLSFRVHSSSVSSVSFNWSSGASKGLVLSSGLDGYLRGLDLGSQKLEIFYQWSYHDSLEKEILWHKQLSDVEVIFGFEKSSYVFDVRSGKRELHFSGGNGSPISINMVSKHFISIPTSSGFRIEDLRSPNKDFYSMNKSCFPSGRERSEVLSVLFDPSNGRDLLINFSDKAICTIPNWLQNQELQCIVPKRKRHHSEGIWSNESVILYSNSKTATARGRKYKLDESFWGERHLGFPHASSIYAHDVQSDQIIGEISNGISETIVDLFSDASNTRFALGNCAGKGTIGFL